MLRSFRRRSRPALVLGEDGSRPRPDPQVHDPRQDRAGGDGRGLQGPRPRPGPLRLHQDDRQGPGHGQQPPRALPARGAGRGEARPPEHHHRLRLRRIPGRHLHGHGAARGDRSPGPHREGRPHDDRGQARDHGADLRRPGFRAHQGHRPPRPEARKHPHPAERPGQDHGLRPGPPRRGCGPHQRHHGARPTTWPRTRPGRHRALRRLFPRRGLLRAALGPPPLRRRLHPGRPLQRRPPQPRAAAGTGIGRARPRGGGGQGPGQGSGRPVSRRRRDAGGAT